MIWTSLVAGHPAVLALRGLRAWPVASQQRARRNAMVAATACAQRRAERAEVESFLTERYRAAAPSDTDSRGATDPHGATLPLRRVARG